MPRCNLFLVAYGEPGLVEGFTRLAQLVRAYAPEVRARAIVDRRYRLWRAAFALRPTYVFSPNPLRRFRPWRGTIAQGVSCVKSAQYERLERAGLPVPRWARLREGDAPDLSRFGPYVVVKPDLGRRGADVRIVKTERVRWKGRASPVDPGNTDQVVQEFVYTGRWPENYRVMTLFGEPLFAARLANERGRPLESRWAFEEGGIMITAAHRGCTWSLLDDPEALALARRVHEQFPETPTLGVDLARDVETGRLYVLEVNPGGSTWLLHGQTGREVQDTFGFDLAAQFDGERKAAQILAARARAEAR